MRWLWTNGSLTIVMFSVFIVFWLGLLLTGHRTWNSELADHGQQSLTLWQYATCGHFWEATAENWEGEFLPIAVFTYLTACLVQKGSPESKEPEADNPSIDRSPNSPWPTRSGWLIRKLYENSLSLAFATLFLASFWLHASTGARAYSREQAIHGQPGATTLQFLGNAEFWFQSLSNWQSEFLANGCMVILSIFLRQKGSPESKHVNTPTWEQD